jgi:hypothetical protein
MLPSLSVWGRKRRSWTGKELSEKCVSVISRYSTIPHSCLCSSRAKFQANCLPGSEYMCIIENTVPRWLTSFNLYWALGYAASSLTFHLSISYRGIGPDWALHLLSLYPLYSGMSYMADGQLEFMSSILQKVPARTIIYFNSRTKFLSAYIRHRITYFRSICFYAAIWMCSAEGSPALWQLPLAYAMESPYSH